jgi:biopolymer transport protein ExbD
LALDYIAKAQDADSGGWGYQPKQAGDTSVTGWQVTALKSGQLAKLKVAATVFDKARKFFESVSFSAQGNAVGGLFRYKDKTSPNPTMTAIGLLCFQYLGVPQTDPAMVEGTAYLMKNLPEAGDRNIYYWFYATQVMHNQPGADWDVWNRKMRRILIDTQAKDGCAKGSWDPQSSQQEVWGLHGGRVMETSLSALTLEVYYRYPSLYRLDTKAAATEKPAHDVLELNIDSTGGVKVNGAAVPHIDRYIADEAKRIRTTAGMTAKQTASGGELPTTVVIRAEGATPFEVLDRVIKMCQDNGFRQFALTKDDKPLSPHSPVKRKK